VIPAILAAPVVEGVLGSVASLASSIFSPPSASSAASAPASTSFAQSLQQVSARASAALYNTPTGSMTTNDWNGMSSTGLHNWMMSLTGKQVQTVDLGGKTLSGVVQGYSTMNGSVGLNVSGHFLPLSNLNQVTWSPAIR
jgi:hypothetical protein